MSVLWVFGNTKVEGAYWQTKCTFLSMLFLQRFKHPSRGFGEDLAGRASLFFSFLLQSKVSTLQTISLVWTLLSKALNGFISCFAKISPGQNPYSGMGPVVEKVLIVCPVSLINVSLSA